MNVDKIMYWLQKLVMTEHHELNNWEAIIIRRTEVAPNIWKYSCNINHNIYLNDNDEPVNFAEQHIIGNDIYYDYNNVDGGCGTFSKIGELNNG